MSNIRYQARLPQAASAAQAKHLAARASVWGGAGFCLMLLVLGKLFPAEATQLRQRMLEGLSPSFSITQTPAQWMESAVTSVEQFFATYEENTTLRAERESVWLMQSKMAELQEENLALRAQMELPHAPEAHPIAARVLANLTSPFNRSFFLNVGADKGIKKDMAVMSLEGMVGRIIEVNDHTSRVLLLTDVNSRIPVIGQTSRQRGIAAGQNAYWLALKHSDPLQMFEADEIVITSGDGGTLPHGLPIGRIQLTENGTPRIDPSVDFNRLDWVSVVDFNW